MSPTTITRLFWVCGAANLLGAGAQLATNSAISTVFPEVFSKFGLVCILLWGLAYIAVSRSYAAVPWLIATFTLEKILYAGSWVWWWSEHHGSFDAIMANTPDAGRFLIVYGVVDILSALFFGYVWFKHRR